MNREIKATLLKIELQIGLIHLDEVIQWCEEQLIYCDENDADLTELALISSQSNRDDVTEVLNIIGRVYDDSVAQWRLLISTNSKYGNDGGYRFRPTQDMAMMEVIDFGIK